MARPKFQVEVEPNSNHEVRTTKVWIKAKEVEHRLSFKQSFLAQTTESAMKSLESTVCSRRFFGMRGRAIGFLLFYSTLLVAIELTTWPFAHGFVRDTRSVFAPGVGRRMRRSEHFLLSSPPSRFGALPTPIQQRETRDPHRMRKHSHRDGSSDEWGRKAIPGSIPELSNAQRTANTTNVSVENLSSTKTAQLVDDTPRQHSRIDPGKPKERATKRQQKGTAKRQQKGANYKQPWKAGYYTSIKTQRRIKNAAAYTSRKSSVERATAVLQTLLSTPPERCNGANLVCALTLSAKLMHRHTTDEFRGLFFQTIDILRLLIDDDSLTVRQLCNAAWAIAKHYDRDGQLLPSNPEKTALSSEGMVGVAETWMLDDSAMNDPSHGIDRAVDEIAMKLVSILDQDPRAAKEGELSMACWAYGVLRQRRRPPGWKIGPQMGQVSQRGKRAQLSGGGNSKFVKFEQWNADRITDECVSLDPPSATDELFDSIADALCEPRALNTTLEMDGAEAPRVEFLEWNELANIAWAFASHGFSCSDPSEDLILSIAHEAASRLRVGGSRARKALSRDIAQIVWSLGTLQADNFRLANGLIELVDAVTVSKLGGRRDGAKSPFNEWSCADIVQVALSLAHARLDEHELLIALYEEALERVRRDLQSTSRSNVRMAFQPWEISILLWAQARLHLTSAQGDVFGMFVPKAVDRILANLENSKSLSDIGIGSQEQANIAWSLTVLEELQSPSAKQLLSKIFASAASTCKKEDLIQLEHAHQLWQALFLLEETSPDAVSNVPSWFREYLHDKWQLEKSRPKLSSARHQSLSNTLELMGIAHYNEHDEDIDVAIVLKPGASWTHETTRNELGEGVKLAVEFDGPNHFTRQRFRGDGSKEKPPRALGHTVLKYRLLKRQGWTLVRVPYYEYDKIPFWASMERQRYLQRLLKTHGNLRFSDVDVSEYKTIVPDRKSRFD